MCRDYLESRIRTMMVKNSTTYIEKVIVLFAVNSSPDYSTTLYCKEAEQGSSESVGSAVYSDICGPLCRSVKMGDEIGKERTLQLCNKLLLQTFAYDELSSY